MVLQVFESSRVSARWIPFERCDSHCEPIRLAVVFSASPDAMPLLLFGLVSLM
jgi:hypothetical protein